MGSCVAGLTAVGDGLVIRGGWSQYAASDYTVLVPGADPLPPVIVPIMLEEGIQRLCLQPDRLEAEHVKGVPDQKFEVRPHSARRSVHRKCVLMC